MSGFCFYGDADQSIAPWRNGVYSSSGRILGLCYRRKVMIEYIYEIFILDRSFEYAPNEFSPKKWHVAETH
jgi:hypothetical protein